jgi:hypothetical protein
VARRKGTTFVPSSGKRLIDFDNEGESTGLGPQLCTEQLRNIKQGQIPAEGRTWRKTPLQGNALGKVKGLL